MFNENKVYNITYDANGDIVRDITAPADPNFTGQKDNLLGIAAPRAIDDESNGYSIGSRWIFGAEIYTCISSVATAAVWQRCFLIEYEQELKYLPGSIVSFENGIYKAIADVPASAFFDDSKWARVLDGGDYDNELIITDPVQAAEGDFKFINYNGISEEIVFSREFNRTFLFRNYSDHEVKLYIKDENGDYADLEDMMVSCKNKFSMRISLEGGKIEWTNGDNALIDDTVLENILSTFDAEAEAAITALGTLATEILTDYNSQNISAYESWKDIYGNPDATESEFVDSIVSAFRHGAVLPPASGSQTVFFNFAEGTMYIDIMDEVSGLPEWKLWINSSTTSFELSAIASLTTLTASTLENLSKNIALEDRLDALENI